MNHTSYAIRVGIGRGLAEFRQSLRSSQDWMFYVVVGLGSLAYLWGNRATPVEGTGLLMPTLILPSMLGGLVVFGGIVGPAFTLAIEREDGTLLRAKAVPHGITGYISGQVLFQSIGVLPMLVVLLLPSALLFDGLMHQGARGWLVVAGYLVLGLATCLPIGFIIGSLATTPNKVSTWGMLPVIGLAIVSGIFVPLSALPGWLQGVAQVFPMYWAGLGMRSAFLPDSAAALEIGGSWRTLETVVVLVLWAIVSMLLLPPLLRRMARRESGSSVEARRQERMQRVG
ncbi:ABC transporter permease [Cellulomonas cellasea]|uniref:ABC transporter n=2 Tax=Cellulomonas cellasea TaxID=43670 RepID=A0A0A0B7E3_9CELL|nr:ABC transporter permease [Cellulomonas cellasea]KGM01161.1 ABC transporter [Cellulomonas cellasea DSM 20118]GEA88040.1 transport permease protein [Cellulomonas cellasea]